MGVGERIVHCVADDTFFYRLSVDKWKIGDTMYDEPYFGNNGNMSLSIDNGVEDIASVSKK